MHSACNESCSQDGKEIPTTVAMFSGSRYRMKLVGMRTTKPDVESQVHKPIYIRVSFEERTLEITISG